MSESNECFARGSEGDGYLHVVSGPGFPMNAVDRSNLIKAAPAMRELLLKLLGDLKDVQALLHQTDCNQRFRETYAHYRGNARAVCAELGIGKKKFYQMKEALISDADEAL